MNNAFYVALSRQNALFRNMSVVANNIANANTTAFKAEKMIFTDLVKKAAANQKIAFAHDVATVRDMRPGELITTGSDFDVAIDGKGFFVVKTDEGRRYTRLGNFAANNAGALVTVDGDKVTGASGEPINIPENSTNISVREDGMVQAFVNGLPEEVGRIGIVSFDDEKELKAVGHGLYEGDGAKPAVEGSFRVVHRSLEQSNVNSVNELTDMIEISRGVGSTAKLIKDLHDLVRKSIEVIGKA